MILDKKKIYILMASNCLTMNDLANSAGVGKTTIFRGFDAKLKPITIGKIAKALEVNVEDIILDEH